MNSLIDVKGLRKEFSLKGTKNVLVAVDDVDVSIQPSQTYGLIGESGSGKTTVGRILLMLLEPTAGVLKFNGVPYQSLHHARFKPILKQMQMVFQDPYYSLNPSRTVWDTVCGASNKSGNERKGLVRDALHMVQIDEGFYDNYPHQISMGQQQRVGIARAIVSKPAFIVLDEPTSSLDLTVRGEIISLLVQLQKELKISYLFISHDLSTIKHMCHKVSVMYLGQIVESGTVEQIFNKSSHPYSKALLSSVMVPNPNIKRNNYILKGEIPSPVNLPNHCYLANRCPEAAEICYKFKPPVKEIEPEHTVRCHRR
jgi:oligopeptide/dipeptide ABC transporter ATP-binding protein